jgi:lipopolysaccharide transport system ATP-binding protein
MSEIAIRVQNLSKIYRIGEKKESYQTLSGKIGSFLKSPFANFKKLRSLSKFDLSKENTDTIWALKDINFEVKKGEVFGIIGKNGAGKSTLLKVLAQISEPTTGRIEIYGRVASLLEVGTGFNPELTGRENVYLNGTILGMTKKEIDRKFDEIVEFSGVEKFIETPVKRYSSGMRMRLAFAVAAFLEAEILLIDEVLAVGDAEFQKKCLGKMNDVANEGRTVLFVSHQMAAVQSLCSKGIVMQNGNIKFEGSTEEAIQFYLHDSVSTLDFINFENRSGNKKIFIENAHVYGQKPDLMPQTGFPFTMEFQLNNSLKLSNDNMKFDLRIDDNLGQRIIWMSDSMLRKDTFIVPNKILFRLDKLNLNKGKYFVTTHISVNNEVSDWIQNAFCFEVTDGDFYGTGKQVPTNQSKLLVDFNVIYK